MTGLRFQRRDRAAHLARMTRHVDNGVECFARERFEAIWSVAVDEYETRAVRDRTGKAARGAGHVMASRAGMCSNGPAQKLAAAQDQQTHELPPSPAATRITLDRPVPVKCNQ
jgi:hypothetical protein